MIIRHTDPDTSKSIVIKGKQDREIVIEKKPKKVIPREDNDPDVTIEGSIRVD